jgi:hypothetical protein
MPADMGFKIAMVLPAKAGDAMVAHAIAKYQPAHVRQKAEGDNLDYKAAYEQAQATIGRLEERIAQLEKTHTSPVEVGPPSKAERRAEFIGGNNDEVAMSLEVRKPLIDVTKRRYVIEANDEELLGRLALLISEGFFDSPKKTEHINDEFRARGWAAQVGRPQPKNLEMAKLAEYGFIRIVGVGSYQSVPGMKVNVKEVEAVA